jgi:N6-L-threonylcarbamoyladenine synthase
LRTDNLDFSFSGLKTAVLTRVKKGIADDQARCDLACEVEAAIVEVLLTKSLAALKASRLNRLVVAGGVSANSSLRAALAQAQTRHGFDVFFPELELCTDNGAMIAFAGALRLQATQTALTPPTYFTVRPRWPLEDLAT